MRIPLPTRASSLTNCRECDDATALGSELCTDCGDASLLQRLEWRYQNDEGVTPWCHPDERINVGREFHPLRWGIGGHVEFGPRAAFISISVGPWTVWVGWNG
jgi:hypothetical protein